MTGHNSKKNHINKKRLLHKAVILPFGPFSGCAQRIVTLLAWRPLGPRSTVNSTS